MRQRVKYYSCMINISGEAIVSVKSAFSIVSSAGEQFLIFQAAGDLLICGCAKIDARASVGVPWYLKIWGRKIRGADTKEVGKLKGILYYYFISKKRNYKMK